MAICSFFLQGRCKFGDKCWNEHPRDGRHHGQNRHQGQASAASSSWNSSGPRYVQPSNFSKNLTWTNRDNDRSSSWSGSGDNRDRSSKSNAPSGFFSSQNRFNALANQDHARDTGQDKEGSLLADIIHDLEAWESSGQWAYSVYCVLKEQSHLSGFTDISPEELRLEFYTSHKEGHLQNYVNSAQQLINQWKHRVHEIKNWNSSHSALLNQLTKPPSAAAPSSFGGPQQSGSFGGPQQSGSFGGPQQSGFGTSSTPATKTATAATFSFKLDSHTAAPTAGASSTFSSAPGFGSKPSSGFGNVGTASASSFSFAPTTTAVGTASTFSGFASAAPGMGSSGFGSAVPSSFGGTAVTSSFGSGSAVSTFGGGISSASGFGGLASSTGTSGFGAGTTGTSSLSTPRTSTFGQGVPVSSASNAGGSSAADVMLSSALFTPRNELSQEDLLQFEAKIFTLGKVPLVPPPVDLLTLK
ncbi:nucleoporin NUP42 [Bufo gargarizans]|uniref:nucleoporin NUP42 n=1 Tax=Bufo gargarizans TaxID=30331 RepID=UPI001CF145DD|nr:nucleoporin NUP42 [Bufo gargarizans]